MLKRTWTAIRHAFSGEVGAIPLEELKQRYEYPDSKYLEIQGMSVHYRDTHTSGNDDAPVLIMLHGIFASLHTWNGWTEALSPYFRLISIDNPNFGLTGSHPKGMQKNLYSDFLNDFTDALGLKKVHMAGNSLGGWMSWEFAARFPDKVEKVILLDSAGFFFIPPPILISMGMPAGGWLAARTPLPRKFLYSIIRTTYGDKSRLSKDTLDLYYDLLMRPGNRQAGARVIAFVRNRGGFGKKLLKQVKQPVLIMWGRDDKWIPLAHVELFKKSLPQAQVIMYDNCGHMPMEELPEQSAADALAFLQTS